MPSHPERPRYAPPHQAPVSIYFRSSDRCCNQSQSSRQRLWHLRRCPVLPRVSSSSLLTRAMGHSKPTGLQPRVHSWLTRVSMLRRSAEQRSVLATVFLRCPLPPYVGRHLLPCSVPLRSGLRQPKLAQSSLKESW